MNVSALRYSYNINTKFPNFKSVETPKNEQSKFTPSKVISVYSDSPIRTKPAQLSLFAMHDFHGQNLKMERAYSIIEKYDKDEIFSENKFFNKEKPVDKLKLASGDMFLGENEKELKVVNEFLNIAGIIATAIGNHECDPNLNLFSEIVKNRNYKFLAANMHPDKKSPLSSIISNSFIIENNDNKYGVIGLAPIDLAHHIKRVSEIDTYNLSDLEGTLKDVQKEVEQLKKQGVNKIILLSHLGLPLEQEIAKKISDIDVILGGHTHNLLKEVKEGENLIKSPKGEPVLIIQVGRDGENVAIPNLLFNELGQITKIQYNVIKTANYPRSQIAKNAFEKILGKPDIVGRAVYTEDPPKDIYATENPHCNFILDCMLEEYDIDIALMNSANIRGRFFEGDISTRELTQITPFKNKMVIANVSEKEIVEAITDRVEDTMESPNHRPGILQVGGIRYEYSKTEGEVTKISFIDKEGKEHPIDIENPREDKFYKVMSDDFCFINDYAGLDLKHRYDEAIAIYDFDKNKIVENYLRKNNKPVVIKSDGRIKIVD